MSIKTDREKHKKRVERKRHSKIGRQKERTIISECAAHVCTLFSSTANL